MRRLLVRSLLAVGSTHSDAASQTAVQARNSWAPVQLQWAALCSSGWRGVAAAAAAVAGSPADAGSKASANQGKFSKLQGSADTKQQQQRTGQKQGPKEEAVSASKPQDAAAAKAPRPAPASNQALPPPQGGRGKSSSSGQDASSSSSAASLSRQDGHAFATKPISVARQARKDLGQALAVLNDSMGRVTKLIKQGRVTGEAADIDIQLALQSSVPFIRHMKAKLASDHPELVQYMLQFSRSNAGQWHYAAQPSSSSGLIPGQSSATASVPATQPPTQDLQAQDAKVLELFMAYLRAYHADKLQRKLPIQDLSQPHQWYPFARSIHRKIIYHAGPTNSGKTHTAVQALKNAQTGVYCSPLRLLALEQYDRLNQEGVRCNLATGEEVREVPGATHVACTVEMANINARWDVAVIDEIQMIGDEHRGSAWTRALLGLPACEVHVCGDATALAVVRRMCQETGEELTVNEYQRPSALRVEDQPLHHVQDVQGGDCIVCFSKMLIYTYKKAIEAYTKHKVCVVYGALPAETRRLQARLFNTPGSGYDVLVATDAVGMGLNLNIRRVIFHSVMRPTGKIDEPLEPLSDSAIKQIAGRAGRRGSDYPEGLVTTVNRADLNRVKSALSTQMSSLDQLKLYPEPEQIERLAATMPGAPFEAVLARFEASEVVLGRNHALCNMSTLADNAKLLAPITNLSVADRLRLCMAPIKANAPHDCSLLFHFATQYAAGVLVPPPRPMQNSRRAALLKLLQRGVLSTLKGLPPKDIKDALYTMNELEECHQMLTLWLWLSYRLNDNKQFVGRSIAQAELANVQFGLARLLELITGTQLEYKIVGTATGAAKKMGKRIRAGPGAERRMVQSVGAVSA